MLDWNLWNKEPGRKRPPRQGAARWWGWSLVLLLLLGVGGVGWVARAREAQRRVDLTRRVADEERAMRFGLGEQARDMVDPAAPAPWRFCYEATFRATPPSLPAPTISAIAWHGERALLTLDYAPRVDERRSLTRAYRLVDQQWRRTPLVAAPSEQARDATRSPHFLLPAAEASPDLSLELEALRDSIVARWPHNSCAACVVSLVVLPQPAAPPLLGVNAQTVCLNAPDLAAPQPRSPLAASAQQRLALVTGVIRALTMPVWLSEYPPPHTPSGQASLAEGPEGEWLALLLMLQEAEARQWLLGPEQRRAVRNAWRDELAGQWTSPFDGPLPLQPDLAPPDLRRRWLMVNLLLEWNIVHGGDENTIAALATTLLAYRPETFDGQRFFSALIGGSLTDLELLARDYVLGRE